MTWIRANYHRLGLYAGIAFLAVSAFFITRSALQLATNLASPTPPVPKPAGPAAKAVELEEATEKLKAPAQWTFTSRSGLFVPERHFIGANGFPATLQTTEVHPPVPNEWLERFDLPIAHADVLAEDPDGDGFNNLEEWRNQTDPTNGTSHPPFIAKLKMKSAGQETLRLVFASWVGNTFALNTNDLKEPTQFLKIGDTIRGTKFKIVKFEEKYASDRYGSKIDVSELRVENSETHEQFALVKERTMISPEPVAHFVYEWGEGKEFAVKKDQEFSLKPMEQIKYKLVDVLPRTAVIIDTHKPEQRIQVPALAR